MRLSTPGRKRQDRIKTIQSLDSTFFIHTEDGGMSRRVQIKSDDISRFGFELRVITHHVMAETMRLQAVAAPDSGHGHVGGAQFLGQSAATPMRAAFIGLTSCPIQNASLQLGRAFGYRASLMPSHQATHALGVKASRPPLH